MKTDGKKMTLEVLRVTPAKAQQWLKKNHPDNRRISPTRVSALANDMRSGNWKLTHQGICFDADGNVIDGQHRLSAIVESDTAIEMVVATNHAGELTDPIDRHRLRSLSFLTGLGSRQLGAAKVLCGLAQGFEYQLPLSPAEALDVFERYRADYERIATVSTSAFFSGVLGALIYAVPVAPDAIVEFAHQVKTGEMIQTGDPAFSFRKWLESNKARQRPWETAMATLSCIRYHVVGKKLRSVFTGEMAYRALTTKRRAMKLPNTPSNDLVQSVNWMPSNNEIAS